jgi:hypothetical protein
MTSREADATPGDGLGEIDFALLRWPDEGTVQAGFNSNRLYEHLSGITWKAVDQLIHEESQLTSRLRQAVADGEDPTDWLEHERDRDDDSLAGGLLDHGVIAATYALNAAGCPTLTSCNGHGGSDHHVVCWVRPNRVGLLIEAAQVAGVGVAVTAEGAVFLYGHRAEAMIRFAAELRARSGRLRQMRRPANVPRDPQQSTGPRHEQMALPGCGCARAPYAELSSATRRKRGSLRRPAVAAT